MNRVRRIGVVFPGRDPQQYATWSGTPAGIIAGLREVGLEPVPLAVGSPRSVRTVASNVIALRYLRPSRDVRTVIRHARGAARASPTMAALDTAFTCSGLGEREGLDGIIQIGSGISLRTDVPIVTFEDMTVAQNREHPYEQYALLTSRALESRMKRQRSMYQQAVSCCLATDWAGESVASDYAIPLDKIHVVGLGFRPLSVEPIQRDWTTPRFLFVGLDWRRKNGDAVLRSFRRLRETIPDARLDVVGGHPTIAEEGVNGHGVLRLDVDRERRIVEQLFLESTCFVMPSVLEAAGIVYLEAASAGLPVIGTKVGGASFLIGDGGVVVDPTDDRALLSSMLRLADPQRAKTVGLRGKERSKLFTWPGVASRLLAALDGKRPQPWWVSDTTNGTAAP